MAYSRFDPMLDFAPHNTMHTGAADASRYRDLPATEYPYGFSHAHFRQSLAGQRGAYGACGPAHGGWVQPQRVHAAEIDGQKPTAGDFKARMHSEFVALIDVHNLPERTTQSLTTPPPSAASSFLSEAPRASKASKKEAAKLSAVKPHKQCAYECCPSPLHSNKWRVVTPDTTAGGRDWTSLMGKTLCDSCYSTFRKHGTFIRSVRTPEGWTRFDLSTEPSDHPPTSAAPKTSGTTAKRPRAGAVVPEAQGDLQGLSKRAARSAPAGNADESPSDDLEVAEGRPSRSRKPSMRLQASILSAPADYLAVASPPRRGRLPARGEAPPVPLLLEEGGEGAQLDPYHAGALPLGGALGRQAYHAYQGGADGVHARSLQDAGDLRNLYGRQVLLNQGLVQPLGHEQESAQYRGNEYRAAAATFKYKAFAAPQEEAVQYREDITSLFVPLSSLSASQMDQEEEELLSNDEAFEGTLDDFLLDVEDGGEGSLHEDSEAASLHSEVASLHDGLQEEARHDDYEANAGDLQDDSEAAFESEASCPDTPPGAAVAFRELGAPPLGYPLS